MGSDSGRYGWNSGSSGGGVEGSFFDSFGGVELEHAPGPGLSRQHPPGRPHEPGDLTSPVVFAVSVRSVSSDLSFSLSPIGVSLMVPFRSSKTKDRAASRIGLYPVWPCLLVSSNFAFDRERTDTYTSAQISVQVAPEFHIRRGEVKLAVVVGVSDQGV